MSETNNNILYYIHDPMCSWCWGFKPVLEQIEQQLPDEVSMQYVLGGLAADSDQPMPEKMQHFLQKTWRTIAEKIPGTEFNYNFWTNCQPRRSTYPSCRAVIAARKQNINKEKTMITEIQKAYYLNAMNPSDNDTLISIAQNINLNTDVFIQDLNSQETRQALMQEIQFAQTLGARGFPSLVFETNEKLTSLNLDYINASNVLHQLSQLLPDN